MYICINSIPVGTVFLSGSVRGVVVLRDTAGTGGCRRRLSLMHMVSIGSSDMSSLT